MSESSASSAAISTCLLSLLLLLLVVVKARVWRVLLSSSSPVAESPHVDTAARTSPPPPPRPRYRHAGWAAVLFLLGFSCQRWFAKVFTIFGEDLLLLINESAYWCFHTMNQGNRYRLFRH